ncbi:hypothetical protein [Haloarcula sediminis]|nr:hypothetical protein [Haloarcula sp. CK38]
MTEFVRATRLYDVEAGEPVAFDWAKLQPIAESQAEIERAVAAIEDRR